MFNFGGVDDVTAPLCGSSQTHLGTSVPSGGGHIINAHQITDAKRLIEKRREKCLKTGDDRPNLPNSAHSLVKTYQREVARQHRLMLKADHAHQQLLLAIQWLKRLFGDEHFVTLLRAEGLDSLPKYLADRIETG